MCKKSKLFRIAIPSLLVLALMMIGSIPGSSRDKYESIDCTAWGTSTQLGHNIGITITIYEFSTPEDREVLVQAFQKGQNQGLVLALQKMRAVGRISIPGTLGYDVAYIRMVPTPTGRKITFATNRPVRFGEAFTDSPTMSYNLTAGELDLNDQDKSKSTGVLYPAAQLIINKDGEMQLDLNQNPWRLGNFLDWKGTSEN
ncbi:MAG: hypothetical protein ABR902_06720 [Candidatus Korobacteraceae bacterium]|jgi:hypothetical protein